MATLLDTLKQNLGQVGAPEAVADETGTVKSLLAAKKGIVGPSTALGPKGLAVSEMAARGAAQQQIAQTAQAAQAESTAISQAAAAQTEEERQRTLQIETQRQQNALQNRIQTEAVLRNLEQNKAALSEAQRRAGMEQVGSQLRLQTRSYVDNLQREGERNRLRDALAFDDQLKRSVADDNIALLKLQLGNQAALDASQREFNKMLAAIDVNAALAMARENSRFAQTQATIQSAGSATSTAIGMYGQSRKGGFDSGYQEYKENLGPGERPVSYTKWQSEQAKGNQPAEEYGGPVA